ncbi:hypothetical protein C7476_13619 [Phyllobacterium bourgognense]|uniref:Uncharacterized protein n=1 Tax=Phyllobacterium bourgognense TaxID=314236 RepID=A0A368YCI4_9HYPH|nr:hypothetical protein C7476_13619 [Phyllobacterium bourgognense]
MNAPGTPHMKLQKNTAKMTAKGEIASDADQAGHVPYQPLALTLLN